MESLWAWIIANPIETISILAIICDVVAGALPDKYAKYPGLILAIANRLYGYGKETKKPAICPKKTGQN